MNSVHRKQLAHYIADRTKDTKGYSKLTKEVAAYLLHEKQTASFESLMRDILEFRANQGDIEAKLISAHELSNDVLNEIRKVIKHEFPSAKTVSVSNKIDPSVVGGVKVELPGQQLDMSVQRKLAVFKRLTGAIKE